jgi:colanic acid/amylovoran biosynthesis glycosyltransferase
MKVAYIVGAFPVISETFIAKQIAGVVARGHEVDIYTTSASETECALPEVARYKLLDKVRPLYASKQRMVGIAKVIGLLVAHGWRAPALVLRAAGHVWKDGLAGALRLLYGVLTFVRLGLPRYDAIHAQFGPYGVLASQLVDIGAICGPIVTSFRGYDAGKELRSNRTAYLKLFRRGALFLPVSQSLLQRLVDAGCDPAKIRVHHSGISTKVLRFSPRARAAGAVTKAITIARLAEKKGVRYGIEAVAQVLAAGRAIEYTIVGDGPLRGELQVLIDRLEIGAHVMLTGWKTHEEVLALMESAHILVAPSVTAGDGDEEGIPNVAKEAMALGLPVLGTRHGGIPELIEDGVSGLLVPERNSEALTTSLIELIDHPERWASMGQVGRRRIEEEYEIDRLNDELINLYRSLGVRAALESGTDASKPSETQSQDSPALRVGRH